MRKAFPVLFIFLLVAAIIVGGTGTGCGGGSSGSNGGPGGGTGGSVSLFPASVTVGANGRVYLHAIRNGAPVDVSWSSTAGVVTPTSVGSAYWEGSSGATVTATAGSSSDTSVITVDGTKASVYGRIIDSQAFSGINNAIIDFKNGTTNVASATSIPTGYFMAAVPTTADRFHVRSSSISSAFYKQYTYDSKRYTMLGSPPCSAPLPPLTVGTSTALLTNVVVAVFGGPPPPPPNGCQ